MYTNVLEQELYRALRHEGGYSYQVETNYEPIHTEWAGVVALADAHPDKQEAALNAFIDVLAKLRRDAIGQAILDEVRALADKNLHDPDIEANRLPAVAFDVLTGSPVVSSEQLLRDIVAVTADDVRELAEQAYVAGLLMVPPGHRADRAGFTAVPRSSKTVVDGVRYPMLGGSSHALVVGDAGVSIVNPDGAGIWVCRSGPYAHGWPAPGANSRVCAGNLKRIPDRYRVDARSWCRGPIRRQPMTDDVRAVARLLPDPARHEPPEGRLHLLRERFMEQITQEHAESRDQTVPETPASPRPVWWRRRLVPALVGGGMAFVLALWLTSAFVLGVGKVWAGRTEAGGLLHRIALVAANSTDIPPLDQIRDEQYVYIETYGSGGGFGAVGSDQDGDWVTEEPARRQTWLSVDGSRPGLLREESNDRDIPLDAVAEPSLQAPTLRYLATLPTDPDLLLAKIYWENGSLNPHRAFVTIGDLIRESIVPPDVAKALYQAAARIPGIDVVHDVEDALGRSGVAIARTDNGIRHELIFDATTLEFLGERMVLTEDAEAPSAEGVTSAPAPAGFVLASTAVVSRAIVDAPSEVPGE